MKLKGTTNGLQDTKREIFCFEWLDYLKLKSNLLRTLVFRVPKPVVNPKRISSNRLIVMVAVPCIICMSSILYFKQCMSEACFPKCRVIWLWFCEPAQTEPITLPPLAPQNLWKAETKKNCFFISTFCKDFKFNITKFKGYSLVSQAFNIAAIANCYVHWCINVSNWRA